MEQAFELSERGRARVFLDLLASSQVELNDDEITQLANKEQEAYTVRQSIQDSLARTRAFIPPDPKLVTELEAELVKTDQEYTSILATINGRNAQSAKFAWPTIR